MRQLLTRLTCTAALIAASAVAVVSLLFQAVEQDAVVRARTEGDVLAVVGVAEATSNPETLRRAVARTTSGREGRIAVRVDGETVGLSRPPDAAGDAVRRTAGTHTVVEGFVPPWRPDATTAALAALLLAAIAVGTGTAVVTTRHRLRPLTRELRSAIGSARAIAAGRPVVPARASSTAETVALVTALDAVAQHIEHVRAAERRLVADLSHRLRTPLTALALDAGSLGDGPVPDRLRRTIASVDTQVDALIRAVRPEAVRPPRTDAVQVVCNRMAFWAALARHRGRVCDVRTVAPPATIGLAADDLAAVLDALLGNAFRYTPEGSALAVHVVRHAGWVTLVVDDAGPGVADPVAALRRGVSGGGSTGLGLDIARDAVEATGGTIHIERATLGGARIRLRFAELGARHADPHEPRAWRLWHPAS